MKTPKMINFEKIEKKWQRKWEKVFRDDEKVLNMCININAHGQYNASNTRDFEK